MPKYEASLEYDLSDGEPEPFNSSDFDEDLSDLAEDEDSSELKVELNEDEQEEMDRRGYVCSEASSYTGSDAETYYEIKEMRDDHKRKEEGEGEG